MTEEKRWYVVYVGDTRRISALPDAVRATASDSAVWIPMKQVYFRMKGKLKEVSKPLFPGYVFVNTTTTAADLENAVNAACGGRFLRGPGRREAAIITDQEMQDIRKLVEVNSKPQSIADRYDLEVGQQIEILTGSLTGFKGYITGIKKEKIVVEVSFFGRNTSAEVDPSACKVVAES